MRRADRRRDLPGWAPVTLAILAVLTVVVGATASRLNADAQAQTQRLDAILAAVTEQRDAAAGTALDLAAIIRGACDTGTIPGQYAAACLRAAEVQADPVPATAAAGRPGRNGIDGVNGLTPLCYFEPAMCRGADSTEPGPKGDKGDKGDPGRDGLPGCDAGTVRDPDTQVCTAVPAPPPAEPEG
jgi:hypothetical protein